MRDKYFNFKTQKYEERGWYMWASPGEFETWYDFLDEYGDIVLKLRHYLFTYAYEDDDERGIISEFEEHFAPMNFEGALERWQSEPHPNEDRGEH